MFINPKKVIENGWIRFPDWMSNELKEKCVQPNAIDWTMDRLFSINQSNTFIIGEDVKQMRGGSEILPVIDRQSQVELWNFDIGCYDVMSNFYVDIPAGVAALLIPRSTFVRNGLFTASGIFDSQFKGNLGLCLHNYCGKVKIVKGTRIAQIAFVKSEDSGIAYAGQYNTEPGKHWADQK